MPETPPAAPHDALFRALLADPGRAETLIREYLPPAVAAELSDAPIRSVEESFVDDVLHRSYSDRLLEESVGFAALGGRPTDSDAGDGPKAEP